MSESLVNGIVDPKTPAGLLVLLEGAVTTLAFLRAGEDEGHKIRPDVWKRAEAEHLRLRNIILMKLEVPARLP